MSAEKLIASHLWLASENLREARLLLEAKGRSSVYLAEQAAEQIILALAASESIHFGRELSHQLDRMLARIPDNNPLKLPLQRISWLEAYATTYKYPRKSGALAPSPASDKLEGALDELAAVLERAATHFGVDLSTGGTQPAERCHPVRSLPL